MWFRTQMSMTSRASRSVTLRRWRASNWSTASPEVFGPLEKLSYTAGDFIDRHGYFSCNHKGPAAEWSIRDGHTYSDRSALRFDAPDPTVALAIDCLTPAVAHLYVRNVGLVGGSALKFGIYRRRETGEWTVGSSQEQRTIPVTDAAAIARKHRDQLIAATHLLADWNSDDTSDAAYATLQRRIGAWELSGDTSYSQNVQTLIAIYSTNSLTYGGYVRRKTSDHSYWAASYRGSHSGLVQDQGMKSGASMISSTFGWRRYSFTGNYSRSHGRTILTPSGLLNPGKVFPTLHRCAEFGRVGIGIPVHLRRGALDRGAGVLEAHVEPFGLAELLSSQLRGSVMARGSSWPQVRQAQGVPSGVTGHAGLCKRRYG